MEARIARLAFSLVVTLTLTNATLAAEYKTTNFVVQAASPQVARIVAEAAEKYRRDLAIEWLGKEMPDWSRPCPVRVQVGPNLGAGGATSFVFDRGEVFGWKMDIQGPMDRLLDSVLPHEVTHTVFATHFRQPLPRWADEGACTTVEHESERDKQQRMLIQFLQTGRGISFSHMFRMKEYPRDVLPLYAQGHSLATYLIQQGGKSKYMQFLSAGLESEDWIGALRNHYGFDNMGKLQNTWLDWVAAGSPAVGNGDITVASATQPVTPNDDVTYRGQDPGVRLASSARDVPGYQQAQPGYPDERSSNRNRQAPPQSQDWRPSDSTPSNTRPANSTPPSNAPVNSKPAAPNQAGNLPPAAQPQPTANETRLLLEWSRGRAANSSGDLSHGDSTTPTRTILR